jgi:hypothetical protein
LGLVFTFGAFVWVWGLNFKFLSSRLHSYNPI